MSFALVLKKTSWYRRRYSRPLRVKGSPNLEKMWFINRQTVVSAVSLGAGRHSIHFVNSQTTVRKYLLPRVDRGRGPTQSIWRSDHGKVIPFLCSGAR